MLPHCVLREKLYNAGSLTPGEQATVPRRTCASAGTTYACKAGKLNHGLSLVEGYITSQRVQGLLKLVRLLLREEGGIGNVTF